MAEAPDEPDADPAEDFEAWARLSARMFRRPIAQRARIVHEAGLDRAWRDIDARWFDALSEDLAAGALERLDRYLALCEAERSARRSRGERVPSPLDEAFADERPITSRPPPPPRRMRESRTPPFTRQPSLEGLRPPPKPSESSTAVLKRDLRDAVASGEAALSWSLEQYAWYCAEIEAAPNRRKTIWLAHHITSAIAAEAVQEVWETRLGSEPALERRHRELVARYLAALRRGDRALAPPAPGRQRPVEP